MRSFWPGDKDKVLIRGIPNGSGIDGIYTGTPRGPGRLARPAARSHSGTPAGTAASRRYVI